MNFISLVRPASSEEVEQVKPTADLTPTSAIWAWPDGDKPSDLAVIRQCMEIDPVYFAPQSGNSRKAMFFWVLLNMLKSQGSKEIYFNVDASGDESYISLLERMGAKRVSPEPQIRFKLEL